MTAINPFGWEGTGQGGEPPPPRPPAFLAGHDGSHPDCPLCRFADEFKTNRALPDGETPEVEVKTASLMDSLLANVTRGEPEKGEEGTEDGVIPPALLDHLRGRNREG